MSVFLGTVAMPESFFSSEQDSDDLPLPTYTRGDMTMEPDSPTLTLTECHTAMLSTIRKARCIGLEIACRKGLFRSRGFPGFSKLIELQGDPRKFDVFLASMGDDELRGWSVVKSPLDSGPLKFLMENLLAVDEDFSDSTGTCLVVFRDY